MFNCVLHKILVRSILSYTPFVHIIKPFRCFCRRLYCFTCDFLGNVYGNSRRTSFNQTTQLNNTISLEMNILSFTDVLFKVTQCYN